MLFISYLDLLFVSLLNPSFINKFACKLKFFQWSMILLYLPAYLCTNVQFQTSVNRKALCNMLYELTEAILCRSTGIHYSQFFYSWKTEVLKLGVEWACIFFLFKKVVCYINCSYNYEENCHICLVLKKDNLLLLSLLCQV